MKTCPKCKKQVNEEHKHCPECGSKIDSKGSGRKVKFLTGVIIILFLGLIACSYIYYNERLALNRCNTNANALSSQLEQANSDKLNLDMSLQTCQSQLSQFKSSPDYFYSTLMHPADTTIKQKASDIMKDFENSTSCLSYGTREVCAYGISPIGTCMYGKTKTEQYCTKPNEAKTIYSSLSNLDVGLQTGMEHYYARAMISNYYWVRDNIHYVLGSGGTQTDLQTIELKAGKCDEQAVLLSSLLRSVGVDAHPAMVRGINHVLTVARFEGYNKTKIPGRTVTVNGKDYLLMDTVCGSCKFGSLPSMDDNQNIEILEFYNVAGSVERVTA